MKAGSHLILKGIGFYGLFIEHDWKYTNEQPGREARVLH